MPIQDFLPPPDVALELQPEELAIPLLKLLINENAAKTGSLNLLSFVGSGQLDEYAGEKHDKIDRAIAEAWIWLEREGMLVPNPSKSSRDWLYGRLYTLQRVESVIHFLYEAEL